MPLRSKSPADRSRSNGRAGTPGDQILDIQTEDNFYTEIFSWGSDHAGQLGLGSGELSSDQNYPAPKFCSYNISIKEVSCGQSHAIFVTMNHYLYSMGSNEHG